MKDADSRSAYYDSGVWLGAMCGTVAGVALQMQQVRLWSAGAYVLCALLGGAVAAAGLCLRHARGSAALSGLGRSGWRWLGFSWAVVAMACLAWALTGCRAQSRLADRLDAALDGQLLVVQGEVDGLPEVRAHGLSFFLRPGGAWRDGEPVRLPGRISLYWPAGAGAAASLPVKSGQTWRVSVRLQRPVAPLNPGGFDLSLWWLEQDVGASGFVQSWGLSPPLRVADTRWGGVDRWRQRLRERIAARVPDARAAGVLAALALGDQSAIDRDDWDIFRRTGVAHLMSISGLHITMFAWLSAALVGWAWRRSLRLMAWWPAPRAASALGVVCAAIYSWFAGWGVPAQRTVLMLAVVTGLRANGRHWPAWWVLGLAAATVLWWDPWAWAQAGFWLSFVAVGVLMSGGAAAHDVAAPQPVDADMAAVDEAQAVGPRRPRWLALAVAAWRRTLGALGRETKEGARAQFIATFSLAPLSLAFFQQISVVGLLANLLAIPWVSFVVTPLALLGALWPPVWDVAAWAVRGCVQVLQVLSSLPHAVWVMPPAPQWAVAAATLGFGLILSPLPVRLRLAGATLVLPLFAMPAPVPPAGEAQVVAFDTAPTAAHWVLVRTAHHTLVWGDESALRHSDPRPAVRLADLLRPLGLAGVDAVLSTARWAGDEGDAATAPAAATPWPHAPCGQARTWRWDGVVFDARPTGLGHGGGGQGCTLRVTAHGASALLSTQVDAPLEEGGAQLVVLTQADRAAVDVAAAAGAAAAVSRRGGHDTVIYLAGPRLARRRGPGPEPERSGPEPAGDVRLAADCGALTWSTAAHKPGAAREAVCEKQREPRYWR